MAEKHKSLKPGWRVWRFDQIATSVNDRIDNPSESGLEHYVGLEHLDPDSLKIRRWGTPDDVEATKLIFKKGDVIFGRRRAYQRKLGLAEFDGICSAHAMVLRAKPEVVLPEFLPFFIQSDTFMKRAIEISVGSLSPTINWKKLAVQEFALPSLNQQLAIHTSLDAVIDLIESLRTALSLIEKARLSYLTDCFPEDYSQRGKLTFESKLIALEQAAEIRTGIALGKKHDSLDLVERPYLRVANVQDGALYLSEMKTIKVKSSDVHRYELRPGDVLMTEGGDFDKLGRGTVWQGELEGCLHQNHVFAVRPKRNSIRSEYVAAVAGSPHGKRYFRRCAKRTSNLASINKKQLSAFPVVYVPIKVQDRIISQLAIIDQAARELTQRHVETAKLKSDLMAKALGEIR